MKLLRNNQKGFTLVEIVIVLPIMALIGFAVTGTIVQLIQSNRSTEHMTALRQVQSAGYWVSNDALQAQTVQTGPSSGFPLSLSWIDWEGNEHGVTYNREPMNNLYKLQRSEDGTNTIVAQYLTGDTACSWDEVTHTLTLTATATLGQHTETRTYEIKPRAL